MIKDCSKPSLYRDSERCVPGFYPLRLAHSLNHLRLRHPRCYYIARWGPVVMVRFLFYSFYPWGLYYILLPVGEGRMPLWHRLCSSPSSWSVRHWWIVLQPSSIFYVACHGLSFVEDMPRYFSLMGGRMMNLMSMGSDHRCQLGCYLLLRRLPFQHVLCICP